MICPNQPLVWDAYSRFGSAGDPLMWYISQPAKCGPLTSHFSRLPSDVRINAPLRVPTSTRTLLIRFSFLCVWPAVNHPRYAELIDEHTKSYGPKCLLEWHLNRPLFFQGMKYAFCLRLLLDAEAHGKAVRFLITIRWNVRTHQALAADNQASVHDLAAPFHGHVLRGRRTLVGKHGFDFGAEALLIELERRLAVAVEMEIRAHLHSLLL